MDTNTIVVGAHRTDDKGSESGSAYVFTKPTDGWGTTSTAAKLTASDGAADDHFGQRVAMHGDTIVVGAHYDDDNGTDSGSAYVFTKPANGWITTSTAAKLTASDGEADDDFGFSVAMHEDTIVVGADEDDDNGTDSGSAYVFTKPTNGWATTSTAAKLTASDGAAYDDFGISVAVHGDTIVVGAWQDEDNGSESGSAYVFTKPANGWATTSTAAKLTTSDGAANDEFGFSVAVHGDTMVVGARQDDDNGNNSGSAYVYELSDWSTVPDSAHNTNPVGANATSYTVTGLTNGQEYNFWIRANNALGTSSPSDLAAATPFNTIPIAVEDNVTTAEDTAIDINVVSNDTDTDGDTLSITAVTTPTSGTAVILQGSTTTVTYTPNANFNGTDTFDYTVTDGADTDTGTVNVTVTAVNDPPVAVDDTASTPEDTAIDINVISNDTDADGDTLSVTAVTTPTSGTAAIVAGSTTTVTYTPNANFVGTDSFTYTVSDGTDTDTGTATIIVGDPPVKPTGLTATAGKNQAALTWDDPSDNSTTGYEYRLRTQVAKLTASDGAANEDFGNSVAVDGDTMVVGAFRDEDNGDNSGSAYVYIRQSGTWNQAAKLTASDGTAGDYFGLSVAMHGNTIVVGAHYDDDNGTDSGSAYVFTKPANGWATTSTAAKLTASDGAADDHFGISVAVHGNTIVVGAHYDDDNGSDSGSAYVFTKPANGWATTSTAAKLTASDGAAYDYFGNSVAVDGDTIVVGAWQDDDNGSDSGSAYVFTKPANGWATTSTAAKLTAPDGAAYDYFGNSVAIHGDTIVVGSYGDDDNGTVSGSAYVFTKPANDWATTSTAAKLTASDGAAYDYFGHSVAVHGDTIVVGARKDNDNGSESGSAYVFTKPTNGWTTTSTAAKLTASDGAAYDEFGLSVAVHGDTIVVGAWQDDDNGTESGSAYVYELSDWSTVPDSAHNTNPVGTNATSYTVTGLTNGQEYNFWIRATNALGTSSPSDLVTVTPVNTIPVAVNDTASTPEDTAIDINVVSNDTDADADTLSVTAVTTPTSGTAAIVAGSTTTVTYTPNANFNGTDSFTYTVSDGTDTDTGTVNLTVTAVNDPPVAVEDNVNTAEDTAIDINLTSNDTDIEGDTLSVTQASTPTNGTAAVTSGSTTTVTYTPNANFNGTDSFTYTVSDGTDTDTGTVTVTVTAVNDPPIAVDDSASTPEDTAIDINVISNDTDADTLSVTQVTTPTNGAAAIVAGSTTTVTYTPNANFNGTDTFDYTVSDGTDTDTGTVSITVTAVNDPPVTVDDTASTDEDTAININVVSNDTDAEGDTLSVTQVTTPSNGTAAIMTGSTTTVTYTPNANFNGSDTFDYTVSDGNDTDTGTVTIIVGDPPAKPTGLTAAARNNQAALTWDDPSDSSITSYEYLKAQVAKLTASDGAADDHFGYSVAVDGDTMVVGSYGDNSNRGSAYVFIRQSGTWNQAAKLTASDGAAVDLFGYSVAVDANTIVIGAHRNDDKGSESGSAYVFTKPANGWVNTSTAAKLTAFDGAAEDWFGYSVAMHGDTIVVGAVYDDDNGAQSGSVYVFTKPANGWTTTSTAAKLTASDGATHDDFGDSVAIHGDTIVVGAYGDDDNGAQSGSAYVFTKPANGWATTSTAAKLTASDGAADDQFGPSVAVHGDTIVVGASQDDDNGSGSGSAYVFTKPANGWGTTSTAAKLTASDGAAYDSFGFSVAVDGDTIVVGAWQDDDDGNTSGSAYVFTKPTNGWATTSTAAKVTTSDGAADDYFGTSVAMYGDTMVVGASRDDDNGQDSGSAYVYELSDWTTVPDSAHNTNPVGANATSYTITGLTNGQEYNFWIRASNALGTSSPSDLAAITPINTIPIAVEDNVTTAEDTAIDINVVANDTDADGDTLSVTAVTTPSNGTAAITAGSTTTVTYTPNTGFTGTDNFEYTLSDGTDTDTGTVNLTVTAVNDPPIAVNRPPVAVNDTASTPKDTAIDINVISNDTDADADTLSVTQVTTPTNGTAAIMAGRTTTTVTYTPNANFNGTDGFDYTVSDGTDTDTGTVNLTVTAVNDPPVAVNDSASTPKDTAININVISNDTDADGDTLSVTAVTTPTSGITAITAGSTTTVTYTPNANYNGTDSFAYTVSDGTATDTGTVNVTVEAAKVTGSSGSGGSSGSISSNADLAALTVSAGALDEDFDPGITDYTMTVANSVASISLNFVTAHSGATAVVRASNVEVPADNIHLTEGSITIIAVVVTAQDRTTTRTYTIQVFRKASVPVADGGRVNQNPTPSFVEGSQTTRWVAENTPSGANIGEPILATDATSDRLSYALLGTDKALFDIDSTSAQLLTNGPLDFESKSRYRVSVGVSNSRGGRDTITVTINLTNTNEPGTVAVLPVQPTVGRTMTAVLTDPDGGITGITWRWTVSSDQVVWLDIPGATSDSYRPTADDAGQHLQVTAIYTDRTGSGQSAQATWDTPLASPAAPESTVTPSPEPTPTATATSPTAVPSAAVVPTPPRATGVPATSAFDPAADDSGIDLWVILLIAAVAIAAAAGLIILGVRLIRGPDPIHR